MSEKQRKKTIFFVLPSAKENERDSFIFLKSPFSYTWSRILFRTIHISCDAFCYVLLEVVVEELVVVFMEAGWSEEIFPFGDW